MDMQVRSKEKSPSFWGPIITIRQEAKRSWACGECFQRGKEWGIPLHNAVTDTEIALTRNTHLILILRSVSEFTKWPRGMAFMICTEVCIEESHKTLWRQSQDRNQPGKWSTPRAQALSISEILRDASPIEIKLWAYFMPRAYLSSFGWRMSWRCEVAKTALCHHFMSESPRTISRVFEVIDNRGGTRRMLLHPVASFRGLDDIGHYLPT